MFRSWVFVGILAAILILSAGTTAAAQDAAPLWHRAEIGVGLAFPFQELNRDVYGAAPAFNLGYAVRFGERAWLTLESGLVTSAGDRVNDDPTFDANVRYWFLPISFGVRTMAGQPDHVVQVGLGVSFQSGIGWERSPDGTTRSTTTFGLALDARPEIPLGDRWTIWIRQRLALLYGTDSRDRLNHSGAHTQLGFSFGSR